MFAVIRVILMSLVFLYIYPKKCFSAHDDELKYDIIGYNWKERKYGK